MEGVAYLAGFYTVMILKFYILFTRRVLFFFSQAYFYEELWAFIS